MPLGIDFVQILLHAFNVVILFGGLYLILYKPVKDFMLKREQHYEALHNEAEEKMKEAEKLQQDYSAKLEKAENEIRERKAQAEEHLLDEKMRSEKEAKANAEKIIEDARREAERQRTLIVGGAREDISKMIEKAAEKMVFGGEDETGFDAFLDETERSGGHA